MVPNWNLPLASVVVLKLPHVTVAPVMGVWEIDSTTFPLAPAVVNGVIAKFTTLVATEQFAV